MFNLFNHSYETHDSQNRTYIDFIDPKIMNFIQYPGYDCRYPTIEPMYFGESLYDELRNASEKLFKIFVKTTEIFQKCPEKFMSDMDMPRKLIPYLNVKNALGLPTWIARFDYVFDKDQNLKMVEINADTPCAIIESYYANQVAADFFKAKNPNEGENRNLQAFMQDIVRKVFDARVDFSTMDFKKDIFLFSCFHDYPEDFGTTLFLKNAVKSNYYCETKFESFYDLSVDNGFVVCKDGSKPKLIYRLHPMELLIEETATDGDNLGILFMEGYKNGKFQMMNPPEAIIMQSKGFQALIYALANIDNSPFSQNEIDTIRRYLPESFFENDFKSINGKYIVKPIWGREGNGIKVMEGTDVQFEKQIENPEDIIQRESTSCLYQKFVEQPMFSVETDYAKDKAGYVTLSCFVLAGKASAVYARFSYEAIAGTEAFWMPLLVE